MSSSPRRVPPPCWTQDQTLALIQAYRDKWYSVNRANLRAADWDAVAAAVAESSSSAHPPKSSVQCRHKIEKLRKRYRAEKQRCVDFPGRFSSSWDLFPLLDAMSIGSVGSKKSQDIDEGIQIGEACRDPNSEFRARKFSRGDEESQSNTARVLGYCKSVGDMNSVSVAFRPDDYGRFDGKLRPDIDSGGYGSGFSVKIEKTPGIWNNLTPQVAKLKGYGNTFDHPRTNNNNSVMFPLRSLGDLPLGYNPNCRKIDTNPNPSYVNGKRYRIGGNVDSWGSGLKNYRKIELGSDVLNGLEKSNDPVKELVSAIRMSAKSFEKVEKMKMEMAMEMEKMRMDMLLKHSQMILESQQQIVDAFAKAALEQNKKKRKEFNRDSEFPARNCASSCRNNIGDE